MFQDRRLVLSQEGVMITTMMKEEETDKGKNRVVSRARGAIHIPLEAGVTLLEEQKGA